MPDAPAPPPAPAAAPAAAPSPDAAAAPAPAGDPRPTGATPKPAPIVKRLGQERRSYTTRPANHTPPPKVAPAPVAPPDVAAAQPAPEASVAALTSPAAPSSADSAAAPKELLPPPEAPKPGEETKLTDAEEARRIARINRASQKLSEQQRAFAEEKRVHQDALRRVGILDQVSKQGVAPGAKLQLLQQVFGWTPQQILDDIVAEGAKPEATRVQEETARVARSQAEQIARLEKQVQDAVKLQQDQKIADDIRSYKQATILPALDTAKHELTLREFGSPQAAADAIFELQEKRFRFTQREVAEGKRAAPELLTPSQAADLYETHFRSLREKWGGASAPPAPGSTANRTEPAPASPSGSPAQKPALNGTYKAPKPSFSVRSVPR